MASKNKRTIITRVVVLLAAFALITYSAWGFWQRYISTHNPLATIPAEAVTYSTDTPDESPPTDACKSYKVARDEPRTIEIGSIGVSGCIQKVGTDQHNAIAVPTNIHLAGWHIHSPRPGQPGVSVIDGHVMGRYGKAIFTNLKHIKIDDIIRIQFGDASWQEFAVVDTASYSVAETTNELFEPLDSVTNQLTLVTCGGTFDRKTQAYDQRLVVRARLL